MVAPFLQGVGEDTDIVATVKPNNISRKNFSRLHPGIWLSNDVVSAFLSLVMDNDFSTNQQAYQANTRLRSHILGTHTMTKFASRDNVSGVLTHDYEQVRTHASKHHPMGQGSSIFNLQYLFVPINELFHWFLVVVDFPAKQILFMDSLEEGNRCEEYLECTFEYLKHEYIHMHGSPLPDQGSWLLLQHRVPQQDNGFDCAVNMCFNVFRKLAGASLAVTPPAITQFRWWMALSILNKAITT